MNKKGFTLVELIAVIGIMGILAIISTPAVIGVRNRIMQNTFQSKINLVLSAAEDYGSEHIMAIPSAFSNKDLAVAFKTDPTLKCDGPNCCVNPITKEACDEDDEYCVCPRHAECFGPDCCTRKEGKQIKACEGSGDCTCYVDNEYCLKITIGSLIEQGYLSGDSDGQNSDDGKDYKGNSGNSKMILSNPIDNSSLNGEFVCIKYDSYVAADRKIVAYIIGQDKLTSLNK